MNSINLVLMNHKVVNPLDEIGFERYLKKTGRKPNVITRYTRLVKVFERFLVENKKVQQVSKASQSDLVEFVQFYEKTMQKSAKTILYALIHYYKSLSLLQMSSKAQELRAPRKTKRGPFPINQLLGFNKNHIDILIKHGIKNVDQMREAGKTKSLRETLSKDTNISYHIILELVQLSDLVRIGYVKRKFTRLFYNAGIKTPSDLKKWNSDNLFEHLKKYITDSGWEGIPPYKSDLTNYINSAKKLAEVIEYE